MQIFLKNSTTSCDNLPHNLLSSLHGMRSFRTLAISFSILALSTGPNQSPRFFETSTFFSSWSSPLFFHRSMNYYSLEIVPGIYSRGISLTYYFAYSCWRNKRHVYFIIKARETYRRDTSNIPPTFDDSVIIPVFIWALQQLFFSTWITLKRRKYRKIIVSIK